jgi:GNAT superfamily N-acetyltransferase
VEGSRPATVEDVPRIAELAELARHELTPMKGGALWATREAIAAPFENAYSALLEREDALVVVGTVDDTVIGFGVVTLEQLRNGDTLGIVSDLFVEPDARAVGVGEAMAEALVAFCTEHGCVGIDALALPGHRAAKNFFEESGFTARALVMHRPLTAGGEDTTDQP